MATRWDRMTREEKYMAAAADCERRCAEQGIPVTITDPGTLAKIARLVQGAKSSVGSPRVAPADSPDPALVGSGRGDLEESA